MPDHSSKSFDQIEDAFGYHKATEDTLPLHTRVRRAFIELGQVLDSAVPGGGDSARDKALMFTELENASMRAHKAIAMQAPVVRE